MDTSSNVSISGIQNYCDVMAHGGEMMVTQWVDIVADWGEILANWGDVVAHWGDVVAH